MITKLLFLVILTASIACSEIYRIKCPSCDATNIAAPNRIEHQSTPLPDTEREVNRRLVKTTRIFACTNCGNAILSVSRQTVEQNVVDSKANISETTTYISSHPAPIKPPKLK